MSGLEIAGFIVALLAFVVSVWQGILTRKHFQVSVRPTITSTFTGLMSTDRIGYLVSNKGLGPAKVKKIFYFYDDKQVGTNESTEWMKAYFSNIDHPQLTCFALNAGNVISMGSDVWIISIDDGHRIPVKQRNELAKKLAKVSIIIHYESVYGERFQHLIQGEVAARSLTKMMEKGQAAI